MLHAEVKALLDADAQWAKPVTALTVEQARAQVRKLLVTQDQVAGCRTTELAVGGLPSRLYKPSGCDESLLPLVLFFHGGGFVTGDIDTHDSIARTLCLGGGCSVLSVGYRRAPENRFPGPVEDCWNALSQALQDAGQLRVDPDRIMVAGDSAGANLAAIVALRARNARSPALRGQLLLYPVTDHYLAGHQSYDSFATGYGLTRNAMVWYWDHYLGDPALASCPEASPLREPNLAGVAPAFVATAELDPLRDEGEAYAERLREAGNEVVLRRYGGLVHGFMRMPRSIAPVREASDDVVAWVRERMGTAA